MAPSMFRLLSLALVLVTSLMSMQYVHGVDDIIPRALDSALVLEPFVAPDHQRRLGSGSTLYKHEIISSFYHIDKKIRRIVVTITFGLTGVYKSIPGSAVCCILPRETIEKANAQTNVTLPRTECTKQNALHEFGGTSAEGECHFYYGQAEDTGIGLLENETKWAVILMDQLGYFKDLRLDATMPMIRSVDVPWQDKPKYQLSFLTELRNVEHSVEELIVYQFLIGFNHGYVYDDGSTDRTKEIVQTYADEGLITLSDVGTMAPQRQFATITRHRMTHLHETEYIVHLDDDIFFVLKEGNQASPLFAEAAIGQMNSKPKIGSMQLNSYWFGPSMHVMPQTFITQSCLWKDPWIGRVRKWRGGDQNNRLSFTRSKAIARTQITHEYGLLQGWALSFADQKRMYFNHYKFRSRSEYQARMDTTSTHGSWAWTSLALTGGKVAIKDDIWQMGHEKLDVAFDPTMLVFGPSLEWLVHAGPKHLQEYVKEERPLLQQHLERKRPLVHFILPAFASKGGKASNTRPGVVTATCALESTLAALKGSHDIWVWKTPSLSEVKPDTSVVAELFNKLFKSEVSGVNATIKEIISTATGSKEEDKPVVKKILAQELFHNTPFGAHPDELWQVGKHHELARAVQLTVAHKYGGLVLDSRVAVHSGKVTANGDKAGTNGASNLNATEFLYRYKDGFGNDVDDTSEATAESTYTGGFVMSVQQRRHVAAWAELERLAGVSEEAFHWTRRNSHEAFAEWPKKIFDKVFLKSGQGVKSDASDACGELARDGWDSLCPNTVKWANCKV